MNTRVIGRNVVFGALASAAAFVSGSAAEPATAAAHCGGHGLSCGYSVYDGGGYCDYSFPGGPTWLQYWSYYYNDCSGTCYNGGQSGCCSSPEACADAPCKPGGCGGACAYSHYTWEYLGPCV